MSWSQRQFRIRRALMDRMAVWSASGWSVQWVNLTSSPRSDSAKLMMHFAQLRRLMVRRLGVAVEWAGVRTKEGFGVLHVLMAAKVVRGKAWSTVCSQEWLSDTWARLHGAPIVWIKGVGGKRLDRVKLSRYMITQYMAHGQGDALVSFFQSRQCAWEGVSLARLRNALRSLVAPNWASHKEAVMDEADRAVFYEALRKGSRKMFRACWDELLSVRSLSFGGEVYVVNAGEIVAL